MSSIGPGDLCIIVKSAHPENIGKIVQVDKLMFPGDEIYVDGSRLRLAKWTKGAKFLVWSKGGLITVSTRHRNGSPRTNPHGSRAGLFPASFLRKLDFDTKDDEMLQLVGKPVQVETRVLVYINKEVT